MKLQDEILTEVQVEEQENVEVPAQAAVAVQEIQLTDEQIAAWKEEHGKIYKNVVDGETYVWRRLRRKEYVNAMSFRSEENPEESVYVRQNIIARTVTLYPDAYTMEQRIEEYAGLAGEISDRAVLKSGFDVSETEEL